MSTPFPFRPESIIAGSVEDKRCITATVDMHEGNLVRIEEWVQGVDPDVWLEPSDPSTGIELNAESAEKLCLIIESWLTNEPGPRCTDCGLVFAPTERHLAIEHAKQTRHSMRALFFVSSAGKSEARRERHEMEVDRDAALAELQHIQACVATLKKLHPVSRATLVSGDDDNDLQKAIDNLYACVETTP